MCLQNWRQNESMSPAKGSWLDCIRARARACVCARVCIRAFPRVFVRVIACGTGNVGTREAIYNVPRY